MYIYSVIIFFYLFWLEKNINVVSFKVLNGAGRLRPNWMLFKYITYYCKCDGIQGDASLSIPQANHTLRNTKHWIDFNIFLGIFLDDEYFSSLIQCWYIVKKCRSAMDLWFYCQNVFIKREKTHFIQGYHTSTLNTSYLSRKQTLLQKWPERYLNAKNFV